MVRIATEEDVDEIYNLNTELFKVLSKIEEKLYNPYGMPKELILTSIKSDRADYILLIEDDKIIGYVLIEKTKTPSDRVKSFKENHFALIDEIVILPEYRMKGYGKLLMDEAISWAKKNELSAIELNVLSRNYGALAFYDSFGFEEYQKKLRKEI